MEAYQTAIFVFLLLFGDYAFPFDKTQTLSLQSSDLAGGWDYTGFIYQGQKYAKPNDKLHVHFYFESGSLVRLHWTRDEDGSSCERLAVYNIEDDILYQKIIWVNPKNSFECAKDPDMTMDEQTQTPISMANENELDLHLGLNGEEFIYILNRIVTDSKTLDYSHPAN